MKKQRITYEKGITLIALVITIIILLILAGLTLKLVFNGGIINKSQQAVDSYSEQSAREKLEIELVNMLAEKVTNPEYNKDKFLTEKLIQAKFSVNGDIVIVDGWQFEIDRNTPKIINSLGKGTKNEKIKIELSQEVSNDYTASTVILKITYNGELKEININGEKINPIPDAVEGVYTITKEIKDNKTVGILVKDAKDNYNISNIPVVDLTEDMEIKTAKDLADFRDKVNDGRTFEGRIVILNSNIDLSTVCGANVNGQEISWEPIGKLTDTPFKGTFNGGNHTISQIYINSTNDYQGLFGNVINAKIDGVIIDNNSSIIGNTSVGGIAGRNIGSKITNCKNYAKIIANSYNAGGINGAIGSNGVIENCKNYASINSGLGNSGGIVGYATGNENGRSSINRCYNEGIITSNASQSGGICGNGNFLDIYYCYNNKSVTGTYFVGGILGYATGTTNSYVINDGSVTGTNKYSDGATYVGGIIGNCDSSKGKNDIIYAYNSAAISGTYHASGGICGCSVGDSSAKNKFSNIYNSGNVTGTTHKASIISAADYTIIEKAYYSSTPSTYIADNKIGNTLDCTYVENLTIPTELVNVKNIK